MAKKKISLQTPVLEFREMLEDYKPFLDATYKSSVIFEVESKLADFGIAYYEDDFTSPHSFESDVVYKSSRLRKQSDDVLNNGIPEKQDQLLEALYVQEKICIDLDYFMKNLDVPIYKNKQRFRNLMRESIGNALLFINHNTGEFFGKPDQIAKNLEEKLLGITQKDFETRAEDLASTFRLRIPIIGKVLFSLFYGYFMKYGEARLNQEKDIARKHAKQWGEAFADLVKSHFKSGLPQELLKKEACDFSIVPSKEQRTAYGQFCVDEYRKQRDIHEAVPVYIRKLLDLKKEEMIQLKGIGGSVAREKFKIGMERLHGKLTDISLRITQNDPYFHTLVNQEKEVINIFKSRIPPSKLYIKQFSNLLLVAANNIPEVASI
ncbi:MAG: hypothetical protein ACTSXQ_03580 [Alphaproteobacteria bacterium]